jgi:hypothetical protein
MTGCKLQRTKRCKGKFNFEGKGTGRQIAKVKEAASRLVEAAASLGCPLGGGRRWAA